MRKSLYKLYKIKSEELRILNDSGSGHIRSLEVTSDSRNRYKVRVWHGIRNAQLAMLLAA